MTCNLIQSKSNTQPQISSPSIKESSNGFQRHPSFLPTIDCKIKAVLVEGDSFMGPAAGYSWAAAGGKPFREEEEADGDYWKLLADLPTCWPAAWKTPAQCNHSTRPI